MRTNCQSEDNEQCNMTYVILPKSESLAWLHAFISSKTVNCAQEKIVTEKWQACESFWFSHLLSSLISLSLPWRVMLSSWSAFCLWLFPPWISIPNMVILLGVSHFPPQPIPFLLCVSSSAHSTVGESRDTGRRDLAGDIVVVAEGVQETWSGSQNEGSYIPHVFFNHGRRE